MKCFITGIGGFVGPYLARHLLEQGHEVSGIDRASATLKNTKILVCDITDRELLLNILKSERPDWIFHLAGQSSVEKSFEQPELTRQINVEGTKNLLDCALNAGLRSRILVVSSSEVYGKQEELPVRETATPNPPSPYAQSRLEQERLCINYYADRGMDIVISRSFNHTGPGQQPVFVCSDFARQIVEIEKGKLDAVRTGNLEVGRDFLDVRDVVKAYALLLERGRAGEFYNVCSGKGYKIGEILGILKGMSKQAISVEQDPGKIKKGDYSIYGDNSKIKKEVGWTPSIPIESTLRDILDYWRKNA